uniref:Uncharacterized protein n=1 Tax=Romanomermis culicivorax TaxID=13658 RepID=A0A915LB23_ROMCU
LRGQLIKLKPHHTDPTVDDDRIEQLEKENNLLKDKLKSLSYQIKAQQPHVVRSHAYHATSSKIISSKSKFAQLNATRRMQIPLPEEHSVQSLPHHGRVKSTEFLEAHVQSLETENNDLKRQIDKMEQKFQFEYEKLKEDTIGNQKIAVSENIETIKLQKQMNEKNAELVLCQLKLKKLEQEYEILKSTKDLALNDLNQCLESLRKEKMASYDLERENLKLKSFGVEKRETAQNDADLENLKRENEILKQTNEVLKNKCVTIKIYSKNYAYTK